MPKLHECKVREAQATIFFLNQQKLIKWTEVEEMYEYLVWIEDHFKITVSITLKRGLCPSEANITTNFWSCTLESCGSFPSIFIELFDNSAASMYICTDKVSLDRVALLKFVHSAANWLIDKFKSWNRVECTEERCLTHIFNHFDALMRICCYSNWKYTIARVIMSTFLLNMYKTWND